MPHSVAKVAFVVVQPIHGIQFLFETIPMVQYDDRQCCLYRQVKGASSQPLTEGSVLV